MNFSALKGGQILLGFFFSSLVLAYNCTTSDKVKINFYTCDHTVDHTGIKVKFPLYVNIKETILDFCVSIKSAVNYVLPEI